MDTLWLFSAVAPFVRAIVFSTGVPLPSYTDNSLTALFWLETKDEGAKQQTGGAAASTPCVPCFVCVFRVCLFFAFRIQI